MNWASKASPAWGFFKIILPRRDWVETPALNHPGPLLDLSLPDIRGLETVVRAVAEAGEVPVVVLTGQNDDSLGLKVVRLGAQDFLVKGEADGWTIVRTLRYAIERKRHEPGRDR